VTEPKAPRPVIVIIGTGGMGLAAARRMASGRTLLLADYSAPKLEQAVETLRAEGHLVESQVVDVSDRHSVAELAGVAQAAGPLAAVVHTAGVSPVMETARRIYEVDLLGTALVIDAFCAVAGPGTSLVCVASMAGHFTSLPEEFERHLATAPSGSLLDHAGLDLDGTDPGLAYTVAKRGNQLRVQAAAFAWGARGARVNSISPGVISTEMGRAELDGPSGEFMRSMIQHSPAGRLGTPDDIAGVVEFLVSPASSFICGEDILVDGGVVVGQRWPAPAAD
jgi:NAD(P)-dependent dehydrogenase (short-subunit alcohol dehydrogenase family)